MMRGSRCYRFVAGVAGLCAAIATSAQAGPALLIDASDGAVYYAEDQDLAWYPASLTKMLTAYITFEAIKSGKITLESKLTVTEKANAQPPSKVGLPVGGEMTVDVALKALIIKSANDVAVMLAEGLAGSEEKFAETMNETAKRLGMTRSNFVNPNGLPDEKQFTTARDMALLARAIIRDFPEYMPLFAEAEMRLGRVRMGTHNSLLKTYAGADGLKTGFICSSGYNVVATATRDNRRLVAIVLGESSGLARTTRAAALLDHGFENNAWVDFFNKRKLDTLPFDPADTTPPQDIRKIVRSWECGNRGVGPRPRNLKNVAKKKADPKAPAAAQVETASSNGTKKQAVKQKAKPEAAKQ
ncbi:MAG: D-alanyl-D-alanine carboxypeptidase [Hyphomicrobiaceae bacterium]|nr:MAG: D-alanyl-D-alanine carboxypeptidase [Hyphomicrobiaceae bacterium]